MPGTTWGSASARTSASASRWAPVDTINFKNDISIYGVFELPVTW